MDDFPQERPRFWIAFTILCIALAAAFVMAVVTSTRVEAQEQMPRCQPLPALVERLGSEYYKERVVWEGTAPIPGGVVEAILFQSTQRTWTFVVVRSGLACILAAGVEGTPINFDKGA